MLNYFIFHAISLLILWAFYQVFLKKDTFFERNRRYMLASMVIAVLAPLLDISLFLGNAPEILDLQTFVLPEISIGEAESAGWDWYKIITSIYGVGVAISLILFLVRIGKLLLLISQFQRLAGTSSTDNVNSSKTKVSPVGKDLEGALKNIKVIPNENASTFSFFNYLFWDSSLNLSQKEEQQILLHELAHIKGKHSYDLIFMELQKIIFWFNPIIYLYEKEIRNQHEFIADSKALKHSDTESYISLMVSSLFQSLKLDFTHSFYNQQIKQRIKMLNTEKTTKLRGNAKTVLAVALVAMVAVAVACSNALTGIEKDQKLSEMKVNQNLTQRELLESYSKELQAFGKKYPKLFEGEKAELTDVAQLNTSGIGKKDKERITFLFSQIQDFIKQQNQARIQSQAAKTPDANNIYSVVEKSAQPIGGMTEMFRFIGENMNYPQEAKEKGVQGKVYVQFVINTDGSLADIEVVKGIGLCDAEAIRVVALTKWEAGEHGGKKVRQRMVMPIIFKLD